MARAISRRRPDGVFEIVRRRTLPSGALAVGGACALALLLAALLGGRALAGVPLLGGAAIFAWVRARGREAAALAPPPIPLRPRPVEGPPVAARRS